MKKCLFIGFLLLPAFSHASNITGWYYTDGSIKVARQSYYPPYLSNSAPECSTCVITRVWDGANINQFGAGNSTVGGVIYLLNGGAADATNAMVKASSMTCEGGTGIVSVAVSSTNVWDTTGRPTQLFLAQYVQILGISAFPYDRSEYNEAIYPPRFRDPGYPGSLLWANRPDHSAFYPVAMVPMEEFAISSFTVSKSSSQAVWIDTYISTTVKNGLASLLSGNCTGQIIITEGATTVATIPYYIKVYNFNFPDTHFFPSSTDVDGPQVDSRMNGGAIDAAGRLHVNQLLHAHGFSSTMGDVPDVNTNEFPSSEYRAYLNGSAYTSANGYGNARGYNTGHKFYMIGTYNSEHGDPAWSGTDANAFCTYASSWSTNLATYAPGVRAAEYFVDEADSTTLVTSNEKWATWLSTKCTMSGSYLNSWVTGTAPTVATYAPHVTMDASTSINGHDPNHNYPNEGGWAYTPSTWQTTMNGYLTAGTTQGWRYNSNIFGSGAVYAYEETGYVPRMNSWADWLKLCAPSPSPGVCKGGFFSWQSNYWNDENNAHNDNHLWSVAKTFGYDVYPTTSAEWNHYGFDYSQGDGVLVWPGKDTIYPTESYGFEGAIATWPLKMYRRGVDDADVMSMASGIDLNTTTTTVRSLISQALWEVPCSDQTDCTYNNTTDRTWSYNPNAYTLGIESLYRIVAGVGGGPFCGDGSCNNGENCTTCSIDCGACPPTCGDASCDGGETCVTCPADCGLCPSSGSGSKTFSGSGTIMGSGTFQ